MAKVGGERHSNPSGGPVEVTVSARHTEVSPALRAAVEEKVGRLARRARIDRADVHFREERNPRIADREVCEVSLRGRGHRFWCKATAADGFVAVDRAVEKLDQQIQRAKTKVLRRDTGFAVTRAS
jgi:putative sigma-54 modulation protein